MQSQENIISSHTKLSAIAGIMFFAPFIKNSIKSDPNFSEYEKKFIEWYIQVWFINIVFLLIVATAAIINAFWFNPILSFVSNVWSFVVYVIIFFSLLACANELPMWGSDEKLVQNIQNKDQILKSFSPFVNFVLWYRHEQYNMPYRWLKESIFLRTIFIFGTIIFGSYLWFIIFVVIIVRVLFLFMNVDIIPFSIKKTINKLFLCNPWEIVVYFSTPLISKIKKIDYEAILENEKNKYIQWQKFGLWLVIQYVLFVAIIFFLYHSMNVWLQQIVLVIAFIMRIFRLFIFYRYKWTFLRLPILSEIVSVFFKD